MDISNYLSIAALVFAAFQYFRSSSVSKDHLSLLSLNSAIEARVVRLETQQANTDAQYKAMGDSMSQLSSQIQLMNQSFVAAISRVEARLEMLLETEQVRHRKDG